MSGTPSASFLNAGSLLEGQTKGERGKTLLAHPFIWHFWVPLSLASECRLRRHSQPRLMIRFAAASDGNGCSFRHSSRKRAFKAFDKAILLRLARSDADRNAGRKLRKQQEREGREARKAKKQQAQEQRQESQQPQQ